MTELNIIKADPLEYALQDSLSRHQRCYYGDEGQMTLDIAPTADDLDLAISIDWHGLPARLLCRRQRLAQWLAPQLQEADFASLPTALQLALLQRESKKVAGLLCKRIEPYSTVDNPFYLRLTLQHEDALLPCWVEGDTDSLLSHLPARPLRERLNIALSLSLQWRAVEVDLVSLSKLAVGDVLLLPPGSSRSPTLLGVLNRTPWADFQLNETQLEFISMYDSTSDNQDEVELGSLEQLPVQISFEVGRQTLDLHTLSSLQSGSLIDLASPLAAQVRILANQRYIGTGELVQIEDRLGVRLTRLMQDGPT